MTTVLNRAAGFTYYTGLLGLLFTGGGLFYLTVFETRAPGETASDLLPESVFVGVIAMVVGISGAWLIRRDGREFLLGNLALLVLAPVALCVCEGLARCVAPDWPAIGLNGVQPGSVQDSRGRVPAIEAESVARGVGLNSWGQRDIPRTIAPAPNAYRVGFVGDSFLEESTPVPVSIRTEEKLKTRQGRREEMEVINLGVPGSSPDEYYYRTKHIALPLGIRHCVVFVYAGNDLNPSPRTLDGFGGIVAVSPRGSLFSALDLWGLNHLLMNRYRPIFRNREVLVEQALTMRRIRSVLDRSDDDAAAAFLHSQARSHARLPPNRDANLAKRLRSPRMAPVYAMLRDPDRGVFWGYYLMTGMMAAADPDMRWLPMREGAAYYWVSKTFLLCREHRIGFTLVIVPEGCQVDSRMHAQWKPLADIRDVTRACRDASRRLAARTRADGIDLVDLHDVLQDVPGTYLNVDGHWSDRGVELVSDEVARWLGKRLNESVVEGPRDFQ